MHHSRTAGLSRRQFLGTCATLAAGASYSLLRPVPGHAAVTSELRLRAAPGSAHLVSPAHEQTATWCYNGSVPGPEIRVRQGERLRIVVENGLDEETTVHWHGVRTPNSMDGVPHLTQEPIAAGGRYVYEFDVPDAGTYWYHPHHRSLEQVGRGLYGALIVEERAPVAVDRDVVWVLDDWRLAGDAQIVDDFANAHDMSHNGRVGNTVTVNGQIREAFAVRRGERIRLRLVNTANARIFGLEFTGHRPTIIALDGQPVAPHEPGDGRVVIGPGMRVDLVLDMGGEPGERFTVKDTFYAGLEYRLLDLVYGAVAMRERPPEASISLPANTLPEPDLAAAVRHEIKFDGGMMGAMMMQGAGNMMEMMRGGKIWFINGVAATGHVMEPFLTLEQGRSYVLDMRSDTAWHHPMHLHGHSFRVIGRNGEPTTHREWQDTVLMEPRERVEIAFVADNPGDWMFHCHVLEHQASGMMGVIRVASQETKT